MTEAELKDLEECSQMWDFVGFTPAEDRKLIAEVRRLREELINRGEHGYGPDHRPCPKGRYVPLDPRKPESVLCTCGFDAALKGAEEGTRL